MIFSPGGKSYYSHPNYRGKDKPTIIHQSSATGMQAIPSTGIAQGIAYLEKVGRMDNFPVVVCSFGDASITEGEVSEAFQVAVLKKLPIIYLVQDNEWGISVTSEEAQKHGCILLCRWFCRDGKNKNRRVRFRAIFPTACSRFFNG